VLNYLTLREWLQLLAVVVVTTKHLQQLPLPLLRIMKIRMHSKSITVLIAYFRFIN
jgi:hypothetical protein